MCQKESWEAIFATTEAHSTQRDQPPRMHRPGLWMNEQKEQRVTSVPMIKWLHYMNCYLKSKLSLKMEQYFATLDIFNIRSKFKFCISRKAEQTLLQTLAKMRNQKLNP